MTIMSRGALIDKARSEISSLMERVKSVESGLIRQGCLNARIHWKAGAKKGKKDVMFMLEPTDENGHREYHHVGKRHANQEKAKGRVAREAARAQLERQRLALAEKIADAEYRFSQLETTYKSLRREAVELEQLSNDKRKEGGDGSSQTDIER